MIDHTNFPDEGGCPLLGKCVKHRCPWYTLVQGNHPQTGAPIDNWACAVAWLPILLIENSQQQRQTGAAVESFRNEVVKGNQQFLGVVNAAARLSNKH